MNRNIYVPGLLLSRLICPRCFSLCTERTASTDSPSFSCTSSICFLFAHVPFPLASDSKPPWSNKTQSYKTVTHISTTYVGPKDDNSSIHQNIYVPGLLSSRLICSRCFSLRTERTASTDRFCMQQLLVQWWRMNVVQWCEWWFWNIVIRETWQCLVVTQVVLSQWWVRSAVMPITRKIIRWAS